MNSAIGNLYFTDNLVDNLIEKTTMIGNKLGIVHLTDRFSPV